VKYTVKAFVYGFRVPGHEYVLGPRQILVCLLYIGMDQVKMLAMLETIGAEMEKTTRALPGYKK
jgi:hypothetical protein